MNRKFGLERESNPIFYKIMEDSNPLWETMNDLQASLEKVKISHLRPKKGIEEARKIGDQIQTLIKGYNKWYEDAIKFSFKPHITLEAKDNLDTSIGFLHYTSVITNRVFQLSHKLDNLTLGYYQVAAMTRYRKSQLGSTMYFTISILITLSIALFDIITRYFC